LSSTTEQISPFSLNAPVFASGSNSFMSFMESSIRPLDESIVEITGVGEAEEEEQQEEKMTHDIEREQAAQI